MKVIVKRNKLEPYAHLNLNPIILNVLLNRGIKKEEDILKFIKKEEKEHSPFLLNDMDKIVDGLISTLNNKKEITVYSDYDADGVCSLIILEKCLKNLGFKVNTWTNDRFKHGYGLNIIGVNDMLKKYPNTEVIITSDNGIASIEGVEYVKDKGLDIYITDHHEPAEKLPNADAVVNPKRKDSTYPFKEICGAFVAYKVMQALYGKLEKELPNVIDFVGLATVADVMPLLDENRKVVRDAIQLINSKNCNKAFKVLKNNLDINKVDSGTFGFTFGSIINAGGRIKGNPELAIKLFQAENETEMDNLTKKLIEINETRKQMTEEYIQKIGGNLQSEEAPIAIVEQGKYHEGIVGIVAGRLKEKYNCVAFVLSETEDGKLKGSGRGIEGFHLKENIVDRLKKEGLIYEGGGHAMACGLTVEKDKFPDFKRRINEIMHESLSEDLLVKKIVVDQMLKEGDCKLSLINDLEKLEPYGQGFSQPLFLLNGVRIKEGQLIGKEKNHTRIKTEKLTILQWNNINLPTCSQLNVSVIGSLSKNEWMGKASVQFMAKEIRYS